MARTKAKLKTPAKYRRFYQVILQSRPRYVGKDLVFDEPLAYSRLKMIPRSEVAVGVMTLKIPVCDLLLGYRRPSYFLIYKLTQVDHTQRKLFFGLRGLTTIPGWRLVSRLGRNDVYHDSQQNLHSYILYHRDSPRTPAALKQALLRVVGAQLAALRAQTRTKTVADILSGALAQHVKKKLQALDEWGTSSIKQFLVFEYLPK